MKKNRLLLMIILIFFSSSQGTIALADEKEIIIYYNNQKKTLLNEKIMITNAYPGYKWQGTSMIIRNQGTKNKFHLFIKVEDNFFSKEQVKGLVRLSQKKEQFTYSFEEIKKGIHLEIEKGETINLIPTFHLNGYKIGNETQNQSFSNNYQLVLEELTEEKAVSIQKKHPFAQRFPRTNENDNFVALLCGSILLLLINVYYIKT